MCIILSIYEEVLLLCHFTDKEAGPRRLNNLLKASTLLVSKWDQDLNSILSDLRATQMGMFHIKKKKKVYLIILSDKSLKSMIVPILL